MRSFHVGGSLGLGGRGEAPRCEKAGARPPPTAAVCCGGLARDLGRPSAACCQGFSLLRT